MGFYFFFFKFKDPLQLMVVLDFTASHLFDLRSPAVLFLPGEQREEHLRALVL